MVTPFLEIQVFGESAISRRMLRFSERAADVSPALEEIAKMFYESEAKQFESEGGWASGGWQPLAVETVIEKSRNNDWSDKILQRTGALMESLTSSESSHGTKTVTPDTLTIESTVPYGIYHQQPGGPTGGVLPMRKPVELPQQVRRDMIKVLQAWIVGAKSIGSLLE